MAKKLKTKKKAKVKVQSLTTSIVGDEGLDETGQPRPTHKPDH